MREIERIEAGYGGLPVLRGVSLAIQSNEAVAIIGPTGAGKSTLVRAICGLLPLTGGAIRHKGRAIHGLPAHARTQHGVAVVELPALLASRTGDGEWTLVLEDLAPAAQGDQLTGCSVAEASVAVRELARLHGPRWDDPTLHDVDWLGRRSNREDSERLAQMYGLFVPGFLATYGDRLDDDQIGVVEP